jgi:phosphoglycolate phosphatase-like HAD superfamily hydrolase
VRRIITDFDGPIADLSGRYYHVYRLCIEGIAADGRKIDPLSAERFWELKRQQVPEIEIAKLTGYDDSQAVAFRQMRDEIAHQLQYLHLDRLIPGTVETLASIQAAGIELVVMTLRRRSELDFALDAFDLHRFFEIDRQFCLSDDCVGSRTVADKCALMARANNILPPAHQTWFVGDTEADIVAAKQYNIPAIAVLSGIRSHDRLLSLSPSTIVANLPAAYQWIVDNS